MGSDHRDVVLALTARLVEAEKQAAAAPLLRESLDALKQALESERQHKAALRQELERRGRPWWRRLTG